MKVHSVNVGKETAINAKSGKTGIFKRPQATPVYISELGLEGDVISDTDNHGGVDQAVYVYGMLDYDWWSNELQQDLKPGTFGENVTVTALESETLCIGDRLICDEVILEVTSPRIPCVTLATRMNDPQFAKRFVQAERYGAYCRVIKIGHLQTGESVTHTAYNGNRVSIVELAHAFYDKKLTPSQIERFLTVPLAIRDRNYYAEKLS